MPSYHSISIINTTADFIIVPATLDGTSPRQSPHEDVLFYAGGPYFRHYDTNALGRRYVVGDPKVFHVPEGVWAGRWIYEIPVDPNLGIPFDKLQKAVRTGFVDATVQHVDRVAIPYFHLRGCRCPASIQDELYRFLETTILAPREIALEVYTYPELDTEVEDDEPTTVASAIERAVEMVKEIAR